jgi:sorbitol/mannitol transport system substrate-binding protein
MRRAGDGGGPGRHTAARAGTALVALAALVLAGCSAAGAGAVGGGDRTTITVAIVSNPQMQDAMALAPEFERDHPDIRVKFVTLPENEARAKITASVATEGGEFDVVMISNYETPQWARNGWLENLQPYAERTPGYDPDDFIPSIRASLSHRGDLHSVPFYGESSFLMYRKDLFEREGLEMPDRPTWRQVRDFAARLDDPGSGRAGICLRGQPGWGEVLGPLNTVINTFGGRYFDPEWRAQLTAPETRRGIEFYVDLVRRYGEPGAATSGFSGCATNYGQGNSAMWYDATSAAGTIEDPKESRVVGKNGYVAAPVERTKNSGWLYTWSLGMPKVAEHKREAWAFMSWMTDKRYLRLVGERFGWERLPPGSRLSTYRIPEYREAAEAFAEPTLRSIRAADQDRATVEPVPYTGIQFLGIPEWQDLGTRISQQISAAIAGRSTVDEALEQSQEYAETLGETYR